MDGAGVSRSTSRRRSDGVSQDPRSPASPSIHPDYQERSLLGRGTMLKVLGWIVLIIFLIGLLVVVGVFDLIF
jgi:hypothetical protein